MKIDPTSNAAGLLFFAWHILFLIASALVFQFGVVPFLQSVYPPPP